MAPLAAAKTENNSVPDLPLRSLVAGNFPSARVPSSPYGRHNNARAIIAPQNCSTLEIGSGCFSAPVVGSAALAVALLLTGAAVIAEAHGREGWVRATSSVAPAALARTGKDGAPSPSPRLARSLFLLPWRRPGPLLLLVSAIRRFGRG